MFHIRQNIMSWFGLVIGVTELLTNITSNNYSTNINSHTLQLTTAHMKSSQSILLYLHQLLPGNGFQCHSFLSFHIHFPTGWQLSHNQLNSELVLLITPWYGPHRNTSPNSSSIVASQLLHGLHREHHFPVTPCYESVA
jgi:hypothetical protein